MSKKNQNTFEKRRRDMEKKLRADEKRKKRLARKAQTDVPRNLADSNGTAAVE